jgi:hypothetical protein
VTLCSLMKASRWFTGMPVYFCQTTMCHIPEDSKPTLHNQYCENLWSHKGRSNLWSACYHQYQNILSSCLSKNAKIKTNKTINLLAVLYNCETWSITECRICIMKYESVCHHSTFCWEKWLTTVYSILGVLEWTASVV